MQINQEKMQALAGFSPGEEVTVDGFPVAIRVSPLRFALMPQFLEVASAVGSGVTTIIAGLDLLKRKFDATPGDDQGEVTFSADELSQIVSQIVSGVDESLVAKVRGLLQEHVDVDLSHPNITLDVVVELLTHFLRGTFMSGNVRRWSALATMATAPNTAP